MKKGDSIILPKGWEIKKLGEICENLDSRRIPITKHLRDAGKYPYYGASGIVDYVADFIFDDDLLLVSEDGANLFARTYPIAFSIKGKVWVNNHAHILKFTNQFTQIYVEFYLNYIHLDEYITGMAQPKLNQQKLNSITIPFPSSTEQQRIVQILDEAFEKIDILKANAERNLQNAKELFQSALTEELKPRKGWEVNKLIEITTKIGSGATPRGGSESYKSEGISLVRSMNVHDFEFRAKNLAFIDEQQAKDLNNVTLQENDVLFNITGASVTRCCIVPKEYLPARVNQHVSIIRLKKDILEPIFLNLLLTSKYYKDQLLSTGAQGATRQAITKVQLEVFEISYPKSIKVQQIIVEHLDALSAHCKELEANYQKTIAQCEEMKKAVLGKAFRGEL